MRMISSRRRPLNVFAWMNQIQSLLQRHDCLLLFLSVCLLTILLGKQVTAVFAQSIQHPFQIVKIDASSFPAVQVYALLRDRSGKPIPTANLGNLTITEKVLDQEEVVSDDLHQFTLNTIATGAEVLFVIDVSGDLTKPGASRDSEWVEMQNVVKFFIDTMQSEDKAGLLIVKGSQVDYLQPLTGDKSLLTQSLRMIPQKAESISFGRDGIEQALFDFSISPSHLNATQAVVFITPQLFHGEEGLDEIIAKAIDAQIQVHCVLTRDIEYTEASEPLIYLAA